MKFIKFLFTCSSLTLLFVGISTSFANDKECGNDSMICVVTGVLEAHVYPGPPEYEDIKKGDAKEEGLYLKLDHPIIIHFLDWENKNAYTTKSISIIQLAGEFDVIRFYRLVKMEKKTHVTIKGKIFASFSAHHHTSFLIDPNNNITVDKK